MTGSLNFGLFKCNNKICSETKILGCAEGDRLHGPSLYLLS